MRMLKMKMLRMKLNPSPPSPSPDDLKTPVLPNSSKEDEVFYHRLVYRLIPSVAIGIFFIFLPYFLFGDNFTTYKPEIRLDSLIYCPTNTPSSNHNNNLVIWDLKFYLTNPNNYSRICFHTFEAGVFFSNETKLLKTMAVPMVCVGPRIHGPTSAVSDAFLVDPYDLDRMMINGTVSFDLKIYVEFSYDYSRLFSRFEQSYTRDVVCRDVKVSSNSGGGCGSFAGHPIVCSYDG